MSVFLVLLQVKNTKEMSKEIIENITEGEYKYGFVSNLDIEEFPKGLNEEIVKMISARKMSLNGF